MGCSPTAVAGSEEYWYDGFGQRIATVKRDKHDTTTELIWWLDDTEAHYDGIGNLVHVYAHLSLGTPVARVDRTTNATTSVEYQFHGLGDNTLAAVQQDGTINASFDYAPFGEIIESTDGGNGNGVDAHRRRMNDKFVDEVSDLAYYGTRYYDRTTMTWTQSDPRYRFAPDSAWTQPRRANLYVAHGSNPLRYIDPDGRGTVPSLGNVALEVGIEIVREIVGDDNGALSRADDALRDQDLRRIDTPGQTYGAPVGPGGLAGTIANAIYDHLSGRDQPVDITSGTNGPPIPGLPNVPGTGQTTENSTGGGTSESSTENTVTHETKKMSEEAGLDEALEQESGITGAQRRSRQTKDTYDDGTPAGQDETINRTQKSEDNVTNRTDRIKSLADALDEEEDDEAE